MSVSLNPIKSEDWKRIDALIGKALDRYRAGEIDRGRAIGMVQHLIAAMARTGEEGASDWRAYLVAVLSGDDDD